MTSSSRDHYQVLNVPRTASQRDIARSYRSLMRTHHPDVDASLAADRSELLRIMQAFATLRDPARRAAYDHSLPPEARPADRTPAGSGGMSPPGAGGKAPPGSGGNSPPGTAGRSASASRDIPVRRVRQQNSEKDKEPPFRVSPVRWESGPWSANNFGRGRRNP